MARPAQALSLVLAFSLAACITSEDGQRGRSPSSSGAGAGVEDAAAPRPVPPPRPWPTTFEAPAVLMAERIVIVGPEGLREHAAVLQDPDHHVYEEKTTREGFVRRTTLKEGIDYLAPIRGRLDGLQLFAERELVVLERPGPVELSIEADGDVFYQETASGEERRAERLQLRGEPE